jgi:transcriptional regulator with XRE-family HTH domain
MKVERPEEVQRLARHLRWAIEVCGMTLRDVEARLGMGDGYLGQLLRGSVDLKVKHVVAVLAVLGMDPAEFFFSLYENRLPRPAVPAPRYPPLPERRRSQAREVVPGVSEERLEDAVRGLLLRMGYGPSGSLPREEEELQPGRREKARRGKSADEGSKRQRRT